MEHSHTNIYIYIVCVYIVDIMAARFNYDIIIIPSIILTAYFFRFFMI